MADVQSWYIGAGPAEDTPHATAASLLRTLHNVAALAARGDAQSQASALAMLGEFHSVTSTLDLDRIEHISARPEHPEFENIGGVLDSVSQTLSKMGQGIYDAGKYAITNPLNTAIKALSLAGWTAKAIIMVAIVCFCPFLLSPGRYPGTPNQDMQDLDAFLDKLLLRNSLKKADKATAPKTAAAAAPTVTPAVTAPTK